MRFFSFFALACAALQAASAIPVPNLASDLITRDDQYIFSSRDVEVLEARQKGGQSKVSKAPKPPAPPKITFEGGSSAHAAKNHLDDLNLHSQKRKAVENYHKDVVADHMKTVPGAHSAVIKNLAHASGSRDPNIHISATIKDQHGNVIEAPRRGNPNIMDPTHHIYTNKENPSDGYKGLPIQYKKAMDKKAVREGRPKGGA